MKTRVFVSAAALALMLPLAAQAQGNADDKAIRGVLQGYEKALNASDVDGVMKLYTADGVFMAQHYPPSVGREAVRKAYEGFFKAVKISIKFEIDEIKLLSDKSAIARTRSAFTLKVQGTDLAPIPDNNQELFVLQKEADGQWKIARYIFSTTNPPAKK
jgi:uncharacterized protein (TIGR02246 family)